MITAEVARSIVETKLEDDITQIQNDFEEAIIEACHNDKLFVEICHNYEVNDAAYCIVCNKLKANKFTINAYSEIIRIWWGDPVP